MKSDPNMPMSDFLYTDSNAKRQKKEWTESEKQKFYDAVRKVGNQPEQISNVIGSKTYSQVKNHI